MKTLINTTILFVTLASVCQAEHCVALLIDNSKHDDAQLARPAVDLGQLTRTLERAGFRCEAVAGLNEKELKSTIEQFADRSPTRGTALVFYRGQVVNGSYNGTEGAAILGTNSKPDRGYLLANAFEAMVNRGGSTQNIVIADPAEPPKAEVDLPADCQLVYSNVAAIANGLAKHVTLSKDVSYAISPPNRMIPGKAVGDQWVDQQGIVFCWCPPGSYLAGSPEGTPGRYADEQQREVTIANGYWLAKYELTLSQNIRNHPRTTIATDKNHPLTMIHHDDGRAMTRSMTEAARKRGDLPSSWEYSLPTEEQWEYAARAGSQSDYSFGDDPSQLPDYGNFGDRSYYDTGDIFSNAADRQLNDGAAYLAKVGSYRPNAWGLYDVHGNVAEWCLDTAIRGGSWVSKPESCRSAYRDRFSSRNEQNFIGYRLVIQPSGK